MALEPVLIAGEWRQAVNPAGSFKAIDPTAGKPLPESYPVSSMRRRDRGVPRRRATRSSRCAAMPVEAVARFLEDYAARIEAAADALVERAARETGLPAAPRLRNVELPRTTDQLRQGAAAARDRSWCAATIDTKANLRSYYGPLGGPVVVFGPEQLSVRVQLGRRAATSSRRSRPATRSSARRTPATRAPAGCSPSWRSRRRAAPGCRRAWCSWSTGRRPTSASRWCPHARVAATGFTGSKSAGLKLKAAADRAGKPIYLEMSSTNPVFVLPGALDERAAAIAKELFDSCAMGAGQFCTRPGLAVVPTSAQGRGVRRRAGGAVQGRHGRARCSARRARRRSPRRWTSWRGSGARVVAGGRPVDGDRVAFEPTLLRGVGDDVPRQPARAADRGVRHRQHRRRRRRRRADGRRWPPALDGNLTGCVYSDTAGKDDDDYARLSAVLRGKVGRLLNDKMPTGVAVSPAMNHGGPYPATGHPGFTAVGIPASLLRFAALRCYDAVRPHRLPPELANKNPTGKMWRLIDGDWSQRDVAE